MRGLAAALLVAALAPLAAQQPAFKSRVEVVTVPITVTNATRDKLITGGLQATDFKVYEDGVAQAVTLFSQERGPVSVCFVVDASGSMATAHRVENGVLALQKAALGLAEGDEVAMVRFSSAVKTVLPWTTKRESPSLTWKLDPAAGSIANSSITDAAKAALEEIDGASHPRRVIVVISDGFENTSVTPMSRLVKTRQQSEVSIYAFAMLGPNERSPSGGTLRNVLPQIVGETGGVYWTVSSPTEAEFAAMSLLNELKYQMTLAYTPLKPFDGNYRRIRVETTVQGLAVRHRGGYLALAPGDRK